MLHDLLEILRVHCVEDIKEVGASRISVIWVFILEVLVEDAILGEILPQVLDGELLEVRDVHILHLLLLEQHLLVVEDLSEEVLVHLGHWWEIVLHWRGIRCRMKETYDACRGSCRSRPCTGVCRRGQRA